MEIGRPRSRLEMTDEELVALGEEMVAWIKENKPTHLSEWYSIEKMILYKRWKKMIEKNSFRPYYEIAASLVAQRCRDKSMSDGISQRFLNLYHWDLKEMERDDLEFQHKLKMQEQRAYTPEDLARAKEMIDWVSAQQANHPVESSSDTEDTEHHSS